MTQTTRTLAGRIGRWSATHRRIAVLSWLAFVIASVAVGISVGQKSGFRSDGAVAPGLPIFLFVILFGLSMDYHVFIVSRVREAHDRGAPGRLELVPAPVAAVAAAARAPRGTGAPISARGCVTQPQAVLAAA